MTTYRTGNPIGSKDPRDLYDNAENLDRAVNSLSGTWKDRFGRTRPTVVGAIDPTGVVQAAANEANRAEAAAEAALAAGNIYSSVAAGQAATVNGKYFWVSADDSLILYKRTSGGSTKEFTYYPMSYFFSEEGSAW